MRRWFILLYAASGAAALIYEVAWTRLLTLQMGHTVAAASTVLAAFMGGLAAGAWIAGRSPEGTQAWRLHAYVALEIGIALSALALPAILAAAVPALSWAYADGTAPVRFALVRVALSLVLISVPATAMGATFPLAAAWLARQVPLNPATLKPRGGVDAANEASVLYAANTAGAALGALAAGFWFIPFLGVRGTTWIGVALNAGAAAGALWLARHSREAPAEPTPAPHQKNRASRKQPPRAPHFPRVPSNPRPGLACTAAVVSGFAALSYEVAWTRLLALVIGPTTYAFATMVASFISGLAIGSAAGARLTRRTARPDTWLAAMLVVTAVAASGAVWFATSHLPLIVASQVANPNAAFGPIVLRQAVTVALLLLPMTFALGAAFPLALAVGSSGVASIGRDAARVYAANTLGAIAGALLSGFGVLPILGLQATFRVAAIVGGVGGAGIWIAGSAPAGARKRPLGLASGAIAIASVAGGLFALPAWDRALLASGAYKYAAYMTTGDLDTALRAGRLEYYKEGAAATVSVRRLAGTLSLAIDGKVDASNGADMQTQRLLGLLPVLLNEHSPNTRSQDICIIGLGSGVTLASALATGTIRRADIVEISPQVVEASAFFARENHDALRADGVRLVVGDGRSHLLLTRRRYDVIISEPSNPWMAGVAALFTREFFEAARARLQPEGLLCQWAHTYDISSEDLRSIVRTFASVFPQATMWLVGDGDLLLIGTAGPAIEPSLSRLVRYPFELLSLYSGGPEEIQRFSDGAAIQTDDRMALEFSAPHGIYGRSVNENTTIIRSLVGAANRPPVIRGAFESATDLMWSARGAMNLESEAYGVAYDDFQRAVTLNSHNVSALRGLSDAAAGAHAQNDARAFLQSLAASQPANAAVRIELSRVLASGRDFDGAVTVAREAIRLAPDDPAPVEQLASIYADAGDAEQLMSLAEGLVARFGAREEPQYYHATALFMQGRTADAVEELQRLVARNPRHARAQNLLGAACATNGQRECARAAFEASLEANPRDLLTYVNLGLFCLESGDAGAAVGYFSEALTIDPTSAAARDGLVQARAAVRK